MLYVRPTRIVISPTVTDATGYPPVHLEIAIPKPDATVASDAPMARIAVDPPSSLPVDSEYIDLVMVRQRGSRAGRGNLSAHAG